MTRYRTGSHHGVTIVRESDGDRCGRPDHDCQRGHLVAVVVDGYDGRTAEEEAERICALLNGEGPVPPGPCPASIDTGVGVEFRRRCELLAGHSGDHKDGGMRWWEMECWHGNTCPGGGPDCGPEARP